MTRGGTGVTSLNALKSLLGIQTTGSLKLAYGQGTANDQITHFDFDPYLFFMIDRTSSWFSATVIIRIDVSSGDNGTGFRIGYSRNGAEVGGASMKLSQNMNISMNPYLAIGY